MLKILLTIILTSAVPLPKDALGPYILSLPQSWTSSPATLSLCHSNDTSNLQLFFSSPVLLLKGSSILLSVFDQLFKETLKIDQPANQTVQILFFNIPTPFNLGVYFLSISVKLGDNGQVFASSAGYTTVAICEKRPAAMNLSVGITDNVPWGSSFEIDMQVVVDQMPAVNDLILVTIDSRFVVTEETECEVENNSTLGVVKSGLGVFSRDNGEFVFAFGQSSVEGAFSLSFRISNVRAPDTPTEFIELKVELINSTSRKVLEWFYNKHSFPDVVYEQGNVFIESWQPADEAVLLQSVIKGLVLYMNLSFVCDHALSVGSTIEIYFEDVNLTSYSYKPPSNQTLTLLSINEAPYFYSESSNIDCLISATLIKCTVLAFIAGKSRMTMYNLVYFDGDSPSINKISTFDINLNTVDALQTPFQLSYSSTMQQLSEPEFFVTTDFSDILNNVVSETGPFTAALYLSLKLPTSIQSTDQITISSIFTDSNLTESNQITLQSPFYTSYSVSSNPIYDLSSSSSLSTSPAIERNTLVIYLNSLSASAGSWISILIYSGSQSTPGPVSLPAYSSSSISRYELVLTYISSSTYLFTKPLFFPARTYNQFTFEPFCANYPGDQKLVALHLTSFFEYNTDSNEYFLMIWFDTNYTFANDLASGLSFGDEYPAVGVSQSETFTLAEPTGFHKAGLKLTQRSGFSTNAISLTFPLGGLASVYQYNLVCQLCVVDQTGNVFVVVSDFLNVSLASGLLGVYDLNSVYFKGENVATVAVRTENQGNLYPMFMQVTLPQGFYVGNELKVSNSGGISPDEIYVFQTGDGRFRFPMLLLESNNYYYIQNSDIFIQNVSLGTFVGSFEVAVVFGSFDVNENNNDCSNLLVTTVVLASNNNLELVYLSPTIAPSFAADYLLVTLTIEIPQNFNFTSSNSIFLQKSNYCGQIQSCIIYTSTSNFSTTITDSSCIGLTQTPIVTTYFTIQLQIIPQITYKTLVLNILDRLEVQYESQALYELNTTTNGVFIEFLSCPYPVTSNMIELYIFPDFPYDENSDLYIKFIPQVDLYAGSVIEVQGESFDNDLKADENTWITSGFTQISITGGNLFLTTAQLVSAKTEFLITKKSAFQVKNPGLSLPFLITVTKNSFLLIQDTVSNTNSSQRYIFKGPPSISILSYSIEKDIDSFYELSLYTISFKANTEIEVDYWIILQFPQEYSTYSGIVTERYELDPLVYYLEVIETQIGCISAAFNILCQMFETQAANSEVELQLLIYNPSTSPLSNITLFIVDSIDSIIAYSNQSISNFTNRTEDLIETVNVYIEDPKNNSSPYTISFSKNQNFSAGDKILIKFPSEFELSLNNHYVSCKIQIQEDPNVTNASSLLYLDFIELTLLNNFTVTVNETVFITLTEIVKPSSGFTRNNTLGSPNWPDYWTSSIILYFISTINNSVVSRTSPDTNQLFLGFYSSNFSKINVFCNGYSNLIVLKPQTFVTCQLAADSLNLFANSVEIFPNSELTFDSVSYKLTRDFPFTNFKVGVPSYFYQGVYYISWEVVEDPFVSGVFFYGPMSSTQVQLFSGLTTEIFVVFDENIVNRKASFPILLTMDPYFPYTPLYITISIAPELDLYALDTNQFVFTSTMNFAYFQILIDESNSTLVANSAVYLNFVLSGSFSNSFEIPQSVLYINQLVEKDYPASASISISYNDATRSNLFYLTLNDSAIVSWSFGPASTYLTPEYSSQGYILSQVFPLNATDTSKSTFEDSLAAYIEYLQTLTGETWTDIQEAKKTYINSFKFAQQVFFPAGKNLLFDSFFTIPTVQYLLVVWVDNLSEELSQIKWTGQTSEFFDHCSVKFTTSENLTDTFFALSLKSPVLKFSEISLNTTALGFSYNFTVFSEFLYKISPCSIVRSTDFSLYLPSTPFTVVYQNLSNASYGVPNLINATTQTSPESLTILVPIKFPSTICCIAEYSPNLNITLQISNIQSAQDRSNSPAAYSNCSYSATQNYSTNILFSTFNTTGYYLVTCIQCNLYPLDPLCTDSNTSFNHSLTITNQEILSDSLFMILSLLYLNFV